MSCGYICCQIVRATGVRAAYVQVVVKISGQGGDLTAERRGGQVLRGLAQGAHRCHVGLCYACLRCGEGHDGLLSFLESVQVG